MVSSDDDMRLYSLIEDSPESLEPNEINRGRLHRVGQNGYARKSFDIMFAFLDVLGKRSRDVPENYERGEVLIDTAMELKTNATKVFAEETTMRLERGLMHQDAIAQTFRSGTNDIDAIDFVDMFLGNDAQMSPDDLNDLYVLENFAQFLQTKNGVWIVASRGMTTLSVCRHSSQHASDLKIISTAFGFSRKVLWLRMCSAPVSSCA